MTPEKRVKKICSTVLALFCVCIVCAPLSFATGKKQLSDALAAVDANLKTPAGKQYDEKIAQEFPAKYISNVRQCKQSNPATSFDPFDIFLRLNSEGKVQEALAYPETALAACTRTALQSGQFSAPPHGEYWINIHLQPKR
jgi:hypothetical protein